jgi:hypothetical protein
VLVADIAPAAPYLDTGLAFNIRDFNGARIGAEYLVGLGHWVDGGLGIEFYRQSVPSVYANYLDPGGFELEQQLKLRMVPFTATIRLLPLGRTSGIQPYIGAGVAIINWRYSESGQFVDVTDYTPFTAQYSATGTATGPLVVGGARFPIGHWAIGGEIKYQEAKGDLPVDKFLAPKIDLGGWTYSATFNVRF